MFSYYIFGLIPLKHRESFVIYKYTKKKKKKKQDMTVPFARARAKLGGSIRVSAVTILIAWW